MHTHLICVPIASLKSAPNPTAEQVDEALYGWPVDIIETAEPYTKIRTFYNYEGYTLSTNLTPTPTDYTPTHTVHQPLADVYAGERVQDTHLLTLPKGAFVQVQAHGTKYSRLTLLNNESPAYIRSQFLDPHQTYGFDRHHLGTLEPDAEEELRRNIIYTAVEYYTTQYRWGGKTPAGIDCSGLTFMAYLLNGIILYRDARIIDGFAAKPITREQLKPADLIYFKGHIGLYLGDNQMIHSSDTNGKVDENNLNDLPTLSYEITGYGSVFI